MTVDQEKYIKAIKQFRKQLIYDRQRAKRFLEACGINDKKGKLTKRYK